MKQEKKMTADEVQLLRERAEKERANHAWAMNLIKDVEKGTVPPLSKGYQMLIAERQRESELMALLEIYAENLGGRLVLDDEVQEYIFKHADKLPQVKEFLIKNFTLCYAVEMCIFKDDNPLFMKVDDEMQEYYPKFSPEGEKFIVEETLKKCRALRSVTSEMYFLTGYTKRYELSPAAQNALMDYLYVRTAWDSVSEALERFVIDYIVKYQNLVIPAQLKLIRSGNHKAIMCYIEHSSQGIQAKEVLNELIERGDREEITAYFNRYANED